MSITSIIINYIGEPVGNRCRWEFLICMRFTALRFMSIHSNWIAVRTIDTLNSSNIYFVATTFSRCTISNSWIVDNII